MFRRKPTDLDESADAAPAAASEDEPAATATKAYTPPKGRQTPKRGSTAVRRAPEAPPANRREAYKRSRERSREDRREAAEGMRRGDERYLLPRDRGPERLLVRNIVDSRRTVGTWFFLGALIVILGSSRAMPPEVQLASNALWVTLALAVVLDSVLITRKIKKLIGERFPKTAQKLGSLYLYAIMRSITFRRMRIPKPQVRFGEPV